MRACARPPLRTETKRSPTSEKPAPDQGCCKMVLDLLVEVSGSGLAGSPDVQAGMLGPRVAFNLHAIYSAECETPWLGCWWLFEMDRVRSVGCRVGEHRLDRGGNRLGAHEAGEHRLVANHIREHERRPLTDLMRQEFRR